MDETRKSGRVPIHTDLVGVPVALLLAVLALYNAAYD